MSETKTPLPRTEKAQEPSKSDTNTGVYTTELLSGVRYRRLYDRIVIRRKRPPETPPPDDG